MGVTASRGVARGRERTGVVRELRIAHGFMKYDYMTGFVPPAVFVVAVAVHQGLAPAQFAGVALEGLALFFLYTYTFCVSNQLSGIAEDRLNKPSRPLLTGMLTEREAWTRLVIALVVYAALGLWFHAFWFVLLWEVVLLLHNQGRWSRNWLGKNAIMGVGTLAQLGAAWAIVAPVTPLGWRWILTLSLVIFTLIPLQDLRDLAGDRAAGRRTFPLVFGTRFTRAYVFVGFLLLPLLVHAELMRGADGLKVVVEVALCVVAWAIAARTVLLRNARADHWTYTLWTWWYTATLASAIVVL
jgi:4-hydroxybenzoate polyprenyltransferase